MTYFVHLTSKWMPLSSKHQLTKFSSGKSWKILYEIWALFLPWNIFDHFILKKGSNWGEKIQFSTISFLQFFFFSRLIDFVFFYKKKLQSYYVIYWWWHSLQERQLFFDFDGFLHAVNCAFCYLQNKTCFLHTVQFSILPFRVLFRIGRKYKRNIWSLTIIWKTMEFTLLTKPEKKTF